VAQKAQLYLERDGVRPETLLNEIAERNGLRWRVEDHGVIRVTALTEEPTGR
jgi:hypothetical protein